jgi:DNA polymerase-1
MAAPWLQTPPQKGRGSGPPAPPAEPRGEYWLSYFASWREIWVVDFEFTKDANGRPDPICLAARELRTGRTIVLWRDQMGPAPPYDCGPDCVFVCYSGSEAELACHLVLGWPLPANVIDLIVEFRLAICGRGHERQLGLLSALARCDLPAEISPEEKDRARQRCIAGWPFSASDRQWIQTYNVSDVDEECALLLALLGRGIAALSPDAAWRGEFLKEIARMWWRGVPMNPRLRQILQDPEVWPQMAKWIVDRHQAEFPFYIEDKLDLDLVEQFFLDNHIPITRTPKTGRISVRVQLLATLAEQYEVLKPFAADRSALGQLHEYPLPVFADNRLRSWFAPFWTISGRAAPPTNEYIYSLPAWWRSMMEPPAGWALAVLDYEAMEFGLAAAFSHDPNMMAFYASGDPYIATGIAFDGMPPGATKESHHELRSLYKVGGLACLYGIKAGSLAGRIKRSKVFARAFIKSHHTVFARYWEWSDGVVAEAIRSGVLVSRHGWHYRVRPPYNPNSLRSWVPQSAGADILRTSVIYAGALDIEMLATAHDSVLIQAPENEIKEKTQQMAWCMEQAALLHTDGFRLRVEVDIKRHGERFIDPRGRDTIPIVDRFLRERGGGHGA